MDYIQKFLEMDRKARRKWRLDNRKELNTASKIVGFFGVYVVAVLCFRQLSNQSTTPSRDHPQDEMEREREKDTSDSIDWLNLIPDQELSASLRLLLPHALTMRPILDERFDIATEQARCARYGMEISDSLKRRRIFYGAPIADDSWHSLALTAIEGYGVFDTVAFVESDTTHTLTHRDLRFNQNSDNLRILEEGGMWGPDARVTVDQYQHDFDQYPKKEVFHIPGQFMSGYVAEQLHREHILKRWKMNGMTEDDIGYVADVDEVVTRDFLRALQICDVPAFDPEMDCKHPKIIASTAVFQGSPQCIQKGRRLHHPDIMIGKCIDQIGAIRGSSDKEESHSQSTVPYPLWGKGEKDQLWKVGDFRMRSGGDQIKGVNGEHTAFHFHNFFNSMSVLRFKYGNYGHAIRGADVKALGDLGDDHIVFMIGCLMERETDGGKWEEAEEGWMALPYEFAPIAFQDVPEYDMLRHKELQEMVREDEDQLGTRK